MISMRAPIGPPWPVACATAPPCRLLLLAFQGQREGAAVAEVAAEEQRSADQVGQVLAQVQAQAGALGVARRRRVELREGLEQLGLVFHADAGAAVGDGEFGDALAVLAALAQAEADRALVGELDG